MLQSVEEFLDEYHELAAETNRTPTDFYAPLTYDGIWSLALALNDSVGRLEQLGMHPLEDFTYENKDMAQIILQSMHRLHFEAMGVRDLRLSCHYHHSFIIYNFI